MINTISDFLFKGKYQHNIAQPFTTQQDVLRKYNQHIAHNSQAIIYMCRPMTNLYVRHILEGSNPSQLLNDDSLFLSRAIEEENTQLAYKERTGCDEYTLSRYAFISTNTPHHTEKLDRKQLNEEAVAQRLQQNAHLMMHFPIGRSNRHQVYLGRTQDGESLSTSRCRFFDANINGGEAIDNCNDLTKLSASLIQNYMENAEDDDTVDITMANSPAKH